MGLKKCLCGQGSNSSLPAFTDNALSAILHLSSMEVLQVRPMQNGIRQGVGGGEMWSHYQPDFKFSVSQQYLKWDCKAPVKGLRPHHLPTFLITYLFSNTFCVPSGHLSRHFWPQNVLFTSQSHWAFPLPLPIKPRFVIFWALLQNGQERHIQSSEENFCRKCQNSKMLSYCRCGSVWDKIQVSVKSQGPALPQPFTAEKETIDLITLMHASVFPKTRL